MKDHSTSVREYVDGVLLGEIVVGALVRAAVERYERDRYIGGSQGLWFDEKKANYAINFFSLLHHSTGEFAGKRFHLENWQKFIIWNLFGWFRGEKRRFRWAFISVARGNGKSPFAAGVANLLTFADLPREARAQTYFYATKEKQAKDIVFAECKQQLKSCPSLMKDLKFNSRRIFNSADCYMEPCGSDSKTNDGLQPHGSILDELHEWGEWNRKLFATIETGMHKRRSPMALMITTAGEDDSEIWAEQHDYSRKVAEGLVSDQSHFSYIAEIDDEDDPLDEAVWPKANPNLGVSVHLDRLRPMAEKARVLPTAATSFKRYHCNKQVASFFKLISPEIWRKGTKPSPVPVEDLPLYLGWDWGWADDLAALAKLWVIEPKDEESLPEYVIDCTAWSPSEAPREHGRDPWKTFVDRGELVITDGESTDIDAIYPVIEEISQQANVICLAGDKNNCSIFLNRVHNHYGITSYEFSQNCRNYNEPTMALVQALADGRVYHSGHKLLGYAADNLSVRSDSNEYVMPTKKKSSGKIDPIVAVIMALGASMAEQPPSYDYYLSNKVEIG